MTNKNEVLLDKDQKKQIRNWENTLPEFTEEAVNQNRYSYSSDF